MEKEINALLETINEGLKGLPPLASDAFKTMVNGTRLTGVSGLLECIGFVVLGYLFFKKTFQLLNDENTYDEFGDIKNGFLTLFVCGGIVFGGLAIIALLNIVPNINNIIAPEYSLIKSIVGGLN